MSRPFIVPSYQNDARFIRICIYYADKTSCPNDVFKLMSKLKVGKKVSLFWVAWAWVAEKSEDYQFTEKIFQKALSVGAEPKKFLEERQKQFLRRMSRHWLNASKSEHEGNLDEDGAAAETENGGREALNSLSRECLERNNRSSAFNNVQTAPVAGIRSRQNRLQNDSQGNGLRQSGRNEGRVAAGFSIFLDSGDSTQGNVLDDDADAACDQQLKTESDKTKENTMRAEQWNERGYGLVISESSASARLIGSNSIAGTAHSSIHGRIRIGGSLTAATPAFDVFVDETCASDDKNPTNVTSKADNRSLRQRLDGGTAERLARDPLRYMKNPNKIESDQLKYDKILDDKPIGDEEANSSDKQLKKGGKKSMVQDRPTTSKICDDHEPLKRSDREQEEYCVEELRQMARYFKLTTPDENFNLLMIAVDRDESQMDVDDSIEEVDMEEDHVVSAKKPTASILRRPSSIRGKRISEDKHTNEYTTVMNPRRVLFGANTNVEYTDHDGPANTSAASSQFNASQDGVEETINTRFAHAEISMMFSDSPEKSLEGSAIKQPLFSSRKYGEGLDEINTSMFGSKRRIAFTPNECHVNDENCLPPLHESSVKRGTNKAFGDTSFAIFQDCGDEKTTQETDAGGQTRNDVKSIVSSGDNTVSSSGLDNDVSGLGGSAKQEKRLGFEIFSDKIKDVEKSAKMTKKKSPSDEKPHRYSGDDTASLSFINNIMGELDGGSKQERGQGFPIFQDYSHDPIKPPRGMPRPDKPLQFTDDETASLSGIGDVMGSLESCSMKETKQPSNFAIFSEDTEEPRKAESKSAGLGFGIHEDIEDNVMKAKKSSLGFEIFNDSDKSNADATSNRGFQIFADDAVNSSQKKRKVTITRVEDVPYFGDISRIDAIGDSDKAITQIVVEPEESLTGREKLNDVKATDYTQFHNMSTESAMKKCMRAAAKTSRIFDNRKEPIPKAFIRKTFTNGISIDLPGGDTATIINELGRGVYGVVLLCNISHCGVRDGGQNGALKIQAPIGSLAHEFSILSKVRDRIKPDANGFHAFPRPKALYAFAEGGLFLMSAGSNSGMTLVDVVNTYNKIRGNVPELIALYYTSRMLRHLESLHENGKILHCDVKPDNWVLTSPSKEIQKSGDDSINGSDLVLVDFGRAVDLEKVNLESLNPLATLFKGNVAAEDMECGTMREGNPWGVDLDYFGMCASSYMLLFGSHMNITQDKSTGRWRLQKSFRRYWQRDLWEMYFDTLLNYNSTSGGKVLRDIRDSFEQYICSEREHEVASHLNQLYTHIPKKR